MYLAELDVARAEMSNLHQQLAHHEESLVKAVADGNQRCDQLQEDPKYYKDRCDELTEE